MSDPTPKQIKYLCDLLEAHGYLTGAYLDLDQAAQLPHSPTGGQRYVKKWVQSLTKHQVSECISAIKRRSEALSVDDEPEPAEETRS